jgi:hypothetical protein
MTAELVDAYHRAPSGRVELIPMKRAEAEFAVWRWPDQWSFDRKTFSARREVAARGEPVEPPSLADRLQRGSSIVGQAK